MTVAAIGDLPVGDSVFTMPHNSMPDVVLKILEIHAAMIVQGGTRGEVERLVRGMIGKAAIVGVSTLGKTKTMKIFEQGSAAVESLRDDKRKNGPR